MKKVITGMGLMQFILMILFLFFIVTLSACNVSGNVSMKEKGLIMNQLNVFKPSIEDRNNADTIHEAELTGEFRYDYLLKYEFGTKRVISIKILLCHFILL